MEFSRCSSLLRGWGQVSHATITIAYDGDAVRDGSMDVRELAPALLALGSLMERVNRLLNEDRAGISIRVRSPFRTGSFEVELQIIQTLAEQVKMLVFLGTSTYSAAQLAEFVGLAASNVSSLISLIKTLAGRKVKSITIIENDAARIETSGDFDAIEVTQTTLRLWRDPEVRRHLRDVVRPLAKPGVDTFKVLGGNGPIETIRKNELPWFDPPGEEPVAEITENKERLIVDIVMPSLRTGRKWVLDDGRGPFHATISDASFIRDVKSRSAQFGEGDQLLVELIRRQIKTGDRIENEFEVVKVLQHIKPDKQASFDDLESLS